MTKTSNITPWHPRAIVDGHTGKRAGSDGIDWVDSDGNEVDDATQVTLGDGFQLGDLGDDGIALGIEPGLIDLTPITPTQLAANTNNWDPVDATDPDLSLADASIIRASTDASRNLTGIVAPITERQVILENIGAFDLVLKHDATSTAANRFYCPNDTDVTLQKDSTAILVYDLTSARWRVIGGGGGSSFGTPSITYGTPAAGVATTAVRTDATIAKPTAADVDFSADVTTNNATASAHGLLRKLSGLATDVLLGDGTWGNIATTASTSSANASGDVTTTSSLADITGASLSLGVGTWVIGGVFDVLVNNALNDRTFEAHLDSGGADQTAISPLIAGTLVNDRFPVTRFWVLTLTGTTTVKLRAKHSGGSAGDFTVKQTNSGIFAWQAGGASLSVPTVVAVGTSATGTGDVTPGLPTGHTTNDILLLFVQSSNQTATAPAGYTKLGPVSGFGTAAAAGSTRLTIFWKRDGGSESAPTVTDTGDHTLAQIMAVRGCPTTGDPFLCIGATKPKTTASTTGTANAGATPVDNCMVVNAFSDTLDSTSARYSSPTNADLTSVTEQIDVGTTDGTGGGIGVITGTKAIAGSFAATTVTETSTTDVSLTFIMLPAGITSRAGFIDRQVFVTAGFADTWTRPTGAKSVTVTAIGGGASGSAGRNAATASGGGGGGGAHSDLREITDPPSTMTPTPGAGGAATANSDGAASNTGTASTVNVGSTRIVAAGGGQPATAAASGSGGAGGAGGGIAISFPSPSAFTITYGSNPAPGGTGGTTAAGGSLQADFGGGGGGGGGTTQATQAGGQAYRNGAGGGGGGRSNTNVGTGGAGSGGLNPGGQTAGAAGTDSAFAEIGGGGGAGGTSAAGPGGQGGWPGGGGGGGGSQSGAQRGGAGGDGVAVITTFC